MSERLTDERLQWWAVNAASTDAGAMARELQERRAAEAEAAKLVHSWRQGLAHPVTDAMVAEVEEAVGMGHGAWDMVDPREIIAAARTCAIQAPTPTPKG